MTYELHLAGLTRTLPIIPLNEDLSIASFVLLGDLELAEAGARELAGLINEEFDYFLTAEAKGIPLIHAMAKEFGHSRYFVARKSVKPYMHSPLVTDVYSITTQKKQQLVLDGKDAADIAGKRVILIDDVVSTGDSLTALTQLAQEAGATVITSAALLAEGDASKRDDIVYLERLPLFPGKAS